MLTKYFKHMCLKYCTSLGGERTGRKEVGVGKGGEGRKGRGMEREEKRKGVEEDGVHPTSAPRSARGWLVGV